VAFVGFEVESAVALNFFKAAVLRVAAITGERLAHHDVQREVNERGAEKDCERPQHLVICPGDAAADKAGKHQADAEPLWKILAGKQLGARAD
jgi:hypothetical protein